MFKDIVLAVTPSRQCAMAADKAFGFAERYASKLHMIHVCGLEQGWGVMQTLAASGETERIQANLVQSYEEKLQQGRQAEVYVAAGVPHIEILRLARRVHADLIVMGPHTREFKEKRARMWGMAGSCLERVSRRAPCPVMIVARGSQGGEQHFSQILVASDFSDQADCAVAYGAQMARHYRGRVAILHVLDTEMEGIEPSYAAAIIQKRQRRMPGAFDHQLRGLKDVEFACVTGNPSLEIVRFAQDCGADLVLMAHHTREPDPEKAFLGSTVVKVSQNAPCPTMSINRAFDMRCGMMYDQSGDVARA